MDLTTTNVLLGIIAAVSVLEALVLIGVAYAGYRLYRQSQQVMRDVERQYVAPLAMRVNGVLDDVKDITTRVSAQTDRVDSAIRATIDRVDTTADRMRSGVTQRVGRAVAIARGVRTAMSAFIRSGEGDGDGTGGRSGGADRSGSATGL